MHIRINKSIKLVLKLAITVAALYIVFRNIDIREVLALFGRSNPWWLLLALAAFVLSQVLSSFRLNQFLRKVEINISERANFRLYLLGMFYNLFLPGGIGGDGYKIYLLNKTYKVKVGKLLWALIMDRLSGLVALVGFLTWAERRYPSQQRHSPHAEGLIFCAWYVHRDGDDCNHPGSPVHGQGCGPVCIGVQRCEVREVASS